MQQRLLSFLMALLAVASGAFFDAGIASACSPTVNLGTTSVGFPASISVPVNAPVGSIVASTTVAIAGTTGTSYSDNCGISGTTYWAINAVGIVANRVAATSVPGIGYTSSISGGGFAGTVGMDSALNGPTLPNNAGANFFPSQVYATVNLVVTGPVGSGSLKLNPSGPGLAGVVGSYYVGGSGQYAFRVISPDNASSIVAQGCAVSTPSVTVTLPKISTSNLPATGSTAGNTPFALGLNCSAGTKVNITLTDSSNPSNTSSTLGLAAGSSASGIGLQILHGSVPVSYGPDSSSAGNTNQWYAGTATGGAMSIPLSVRYLRTPGTLAPGSANGLATFTMSYQ